MKVYVTRIGNDTQVQAEVNQLLRVKRVKVVDIKFSCGPNGMAAMVIYEERGEAA